jgi:hypothetical protein
MNKEMEALERMLTYKISSKTKFGMKNVEDYNLVKSALTELEEIKRRAESIPNFLTGYLVDGNSMQEIVDSVTKSVKNYILKGEPK